MQQPAKQRIGRALNKNRAPGKGQKAPNTFGAPLTEPEAKRTASAQAGLATNPAINSIRGEARASRQRQAQIGQEYAGLDSQIQQGGLQDQAASAAANAALQKQLETAQHGSQAQQAQIAGGNAEFAKLVGANPTAFAQPAQTAAEAGVQRSYTQAALAAPIIQAGASQAAFNQNEAANATHEGIFQRQQEANRRQTIKQDLQKAQRAKGEAKVEDLDKLREAAERSRISRAAFNLEGKKFGAEQAAGSAEAAQQQTQQQIENAQKNRELNQEGRKIGNETKVGGKTPAERNEAKKGFSNALNAAQVKIRQHGVPENPAEWAELQEAVEKGSEISPSDAARAIKKLHQKLGPKAAAGNVAKHFSPFG